MLAVGLRLETNYSQIRSQIYLFNDLTSFPAFILLSNRKQSGVYSLYPIRAQHALGCCCDLAGNALDLLSSRCYYNA